MSATGINHPYIVQLLSTNLNNQRNDGRNCDFQLKTDDGTSFPVHRSVLEATCNFFITYFDSQLNDSKDELVLEKTSAEALSRILNYLYVGETTVSPEITEIKQLLDIALYLGMSQLVDACTELLLISVDQDNCCELLLYSETYHLGDKLRQKCFNFILDNIQFFKEMNLSEILSSNHIKSVLSWKRSKNNSSEESLYLAVQDWILKNFEERQNYISEFLDKIHFEWLSNEFYAEKIFNDDNPLKNNLQFLNKVFSINKTFMTNFSKSKKNKDFSINTFLETYSDPNLHGVVGTEILKFDWSKKNFTDKITDTGIYTNGYTIFGDQNIFMCGGRIKGMINESCSCKYFSIHEAKWYDLPSMNEARYCHRVITLSDKIYACGGQGLKTMEVFDINTSRWQTAPSLKMNMENFGFCAHNDCVYAAGYTNFERLDPREGNWTTLPALPGTCIYYAVGYDNFIQSFNHIGGYKFDLRMNKWSEMVTSHSKKYAQIPGSCLIQSKIYVFGNVTESQYLLEVYDAVDLSSHNSFIFNREHSHIWSVFNILNS